MKVHLDRAMVLRQPWAQAVVEGSFPVLVRSQPTNIRGFVGILSTRNMDPKAEVRDPDAFLPEHILGAVFLEGCVELEGNAEAFLAHRFSQELAEFYPPHFIPDEDPKYAWILSRCIVADDPVPWDGTLTPGWVRIDQEIEGEGYKLVERSETSDLGSGTVSD